MFWRFGGYANVSAIDTLLEKPDVTLEELLEESDLIQELKSHNTKLIEHLREDSILERLLEYVVAPKLLPETVEDDSDDQDSEKKGKEKDRSSSRSHISAEDEEDEREKKRNRYAYTAAEILSSDSWSLSAALLENQELLRKFWGFLKLPPPLDPLQASYFTKVNEALLDKKTEDMLDLFKSLDNVVKDMLQHVDSPMVMDLLLKIISLEKAEGGAGTVDWLHSQDLMPILLSFLSAEHSWATQTSAGDFLKAIITISANASQNEQSCIGPNELTRQLVSHECVEKLINDMLKGGNPLTVGVGIVIEVIRKNNSDYDPDVGAEANTPPSSRDPIYLGTLLRMFATHVPDFMQLILSPNHTIGGGDGPVTIKRQELRAAFGSKIEPLGFDRFKTCELMAELLHCSNMGLLNELGSDEFVKARDAERERLRTEGKLTISSEDRRGSGGDDLTMKSSTNTRFSDPPDELRRLEVQNASDDDGFEEVTHSGDLGDDVKDDFYEKPDMVDDILTPTKLDSSLSFLDQDSAEFVDEPLSSPRLKPDAEIPSLDNPDPTMVVQPLSPLSPTKELSQEVRGLHFDEDKDTSMTTPPTDPEPSALDVAANLESDLNDTLKELQPQVTTESVPTQQSITTGDASVPVQQPLEALSPHPDDKPAPLFSRRAEESATKNLPETAVSGDGTDESSTSTPKSGDTADTTMADVGDVSSSVLMGNTDEHEQEQSRTGAADEAEPLPVVGDYLKMQFVEHKVVPTILDFFFRFPWNNFLHNVVYDVVQQVFNGPMDRGYNRTLAIDLFDTGDITMRIVDGQKKSDEAQEKNRMRLGYMGHLTLIAEEVVKFTERHPPELLSESVLEKVMNGEWITYVEVTLAETRERDNAILGGVRPDMSVGPRQAVMNAVNAASAFGGGGSSALADAGLNGTGLDSMDLANGNGVTSTGFTITGGSLLSGFGSSSDDEDEEMDEDNEEEGLRNSGAESQFSRYITTPSTTVATSSSTTDNLEGSGPPLAPPPPPPPLNIPPSRARRQLAARLALHKQNAESANGGSGEGAHETGRTDQRKNLNPFAAEEDDDEDGDEADDFTIGDLEAEEEGKGHLPPGTGLVGSQGTIDDLVLADIEGDNVGIPFTKSHPLCDSDAASSPGPEPRANFPSMWPFGQQGRFALDQEDQGENGSGRENGEARRIDRSHNIGADYSSQSSDSSSSDEDDVGGFGAGIEKAGSGSGLGKGKRRRPSTTEAVRRTSLEDDDEDEVELFTGKPNEDKDSVEAKHQSHEVEMQGVEGSSSDHVHGA